MNLLCTVCTSFSKTFSLCSALRDTSCVSKTRFVAVEILYLDFSYLSNQTAELDLK